MFEIGQQCVINNPSHRLDGEICFVVGISSNGKRIAVSDVPPGQFRGLDFVKFSIGLSPNQLEIV